MTGFHRSGKLRRTSSENGTESDGWEAVGDFLESSFSSKVKLEVKWKERHVHGGENSEMFYGVDNLMLLLLGWQVAGPLIKSLS